ncbi:MAG: hypothetical protein GWM92_06045 [Gemmatimonadetes bacterium]|nr:hypothetical protein [Gemmatimonadota bacterium]NIR78175.1 hypothetical protein [Gemmatimonadota bacterium]NIT86745.1 hypothetical protein [Gemmatimonadota bacterium]NIU30606.1 hypothetical protein [Gemmatimonadota bacterium]NIU35421.1 hypothetical protein [Gemmatimonadota bacterium]
MGHLLTHALLWGLGLGAFLTVAFLGLLRLDPEMWLGDYPPDIQERFGPVGEKAGRQRLLLGIPVMTVALAVVVLGTIDFARTGPSVPGFLDVALHTFVFLMVFNVVDLVLIDWLIVVWMRPEWVVLPGTEGMEGYGDYEFHFRAFLKGTVGIGVVSVLAGAIHAVMG